MLSQLLPLLLHAPFALPLLLLIVWTAGLSTCKSSHFSVYDEVNTHVPPNFYCMYEHVYFMNITRTVKLIIGTAL